MKFRILSDLHLTLENNDSILNPIEGLREKIDVSKDKEEGIITLVAGDISHDPTITKKFFDMFPEMTGAFVEGNHLVYNHSTYTLQELQAGLKHEFPAGSHMKFLENNTLELPNNYLVVGATFWTDYNFFGTKERSEYWAEAFMNDFRFGKLNIDKDGNIAEAFDRDRVEKFTAAYLQKIHKTSFEYIKSIVEANPDKKIIVLTHHAPTSKAINQQYRLNKITPAFVSNYDQFIIEHPNIVAWVCGHSHHCKSDMLHNTAILVNAIGYKSETYTKHWDLVVEI